MAVEWSISGLHDAVWRQIAASRRGAPAGRMIDVACGPGEFVTRFAKAGWTTVACDANVEAFQGEAGRHVACDLNADWPRAIGDESFDLVVAQEIIEHLESPALFLRQLASVTRPGGTCVLTSPNSQDKASRIDFLFEGELPWFRVDQLHTNGHCTPITIPLLYLFAITAGFELTAFYGYGRRVPPKLNWRGRLFERYLDRKLTGPCLANVINIWFFTRSAEPPLSLRHLDPAVLARGLQWYREKPCVSIDNAMP